MILNRIKNLLLENVLIKLVSILFAVILWLYVNSRGGTEMEITVPLELQNMPARLVVVGDMIDDVTVRVRGRERVLQEITSRPIHAVLNLTGAREGENIFFLDPSAIAVPSNVQIARINPRRVTVRMEALQKKEILVTADLSGNPAAGFRISRVEVLPPSISVEGPRSVVDPLSHLATEPVDVSGARKSIDREVRVNLLGKELRVDPDKPVRINIHIVGQN